MPQNQQLSLVLAGMGLFPAADEEDAETNVKPVVQPVPLVRGGYSYTMALLAGLVSFIAYQAYQVSRGGGSYANDCGNSFNLGDLNLTHSLNLTRTVPVRENGWGIVRMLNRRAEASDSGSDHVLILVRKDAYSPDRLERCKGGIQTGFQNDILHLGSMMNGVGSMVKKVHYHGALCDDTRQNAVLSFLMSPACKGKDPSDWALAPFHEAMEKACSFYAHVPGIGKMVAGDMLVPQRMCTLFQKSRTISSTMRLADLLHDSHHGFMHIDFPSLNDDSSMSYVVVVVANSEGDAMSVYEGLGVLKKGTVIVFAMMQGTGAGLPSMARPFLQCGRTGKCWILHV